MTSASSLVSVVLITLDGEEFLRAQLEALAAQTYPGPWELIVADNGSKDGTLPLVRTLAERLPNLRVVDASARGGPSAARNAGARVARGEVLLFCDQDDVVAPGWIEGMVEALAHHDLVGGRLDRDTLNGRRMRAWRPAQSLREGLEVRHDFLPACPTCNFGIRSSVLRSLGGWDETFIHSHDVELCWRAQLAGYSFGFAPDAVVAYRYRRTLRALGRQYYGYGQGAPHLYRAFRDRGVPRRTTRRAALAWLRLLKQLPRALVHPDTRGRWVRRAASHAGRLRGSIRHRVWFP